MTGILLLAFAPVISPLAHAVTMPATELDGGLYGVKQWNFVTSTWQTTASAWVNVHDFDPGTGVQHHEHWYFTPSWDPDNPKRQFRFFGPPLPEDKRPNFPNLTHVLYHVTGHTPVVQATPSTVTATATCTGTRHLCPSRFYTIAHTDGGTVTGRANVFDVTGPVTHENFTLEQGAFIRASGANCLVEWHMVEYEPDLPGPTKDDLVATGAQNHQRNWAFTVSASLPPNPVTIGNPPPCPP